MTREKQADHLLSWSVCLPHIDWKLCHKLPNGAWQNKMVPHLWIGNSLLTYKTWRNTTTFHWLTDGWHPKWCLASMKITPGETQQVESKSLRLWCYLCFLAPLPEHTSDSWEASREWEWSSRFTADDAGDQVALSTRDQTCIKHTLGLYFNPCIISQSMTLPFMLQNLLCDLKDARNQRILIARRGVWKLFYISVIRENVVLYFRLSLPEF